MPASFRYLHDPELRVQRDRHDELAIAATALDEARMNALRAVRKELTDTTLVVMAPNGPVFIQLFVLIDGEPYRAWVTEFLSRKMDIDHNGLLSETELSLIPERLKQQTLRYKTVEP